MNAGARRRALSKTIRAIARSKTQSPTKKYQAHRQVRIIQPSGKCKPNMKQTKPEPGIPLRRAE